MIALPFITVELLHDGASTPGIESLAQEYVIGSLRSMMTNLYENVKSGVGVYANHLGCFAEQLAMNEKRRASCIKQLVKAPVEGDFASLQVSIHSSMTRI